jgi:hypothetical protein
MIRNGFVVPLSFCIMGYTITVEWNERLRHHEDLVGLAMHRDNKIVIQPSVPGNPRTSEQIEHTFFHELVHFILDAMQEEELRKNEKFVDVFSGLLHQALTTMEY